MGKQTVESLVSRAGELVGTPNWAKAEKLIRESLRRDPRNRNARRVWARFLTDHLARPAEALEILLELEQGPEVHYDLADVYFQKAQALHSLGRPAEAVASWDLCLTHMIYGEHPNIRAMVWGNRAAALKTIDLRKALESAETAIESWVECDVGWYNKSCYEALLGDVARANGALAIAARLEGKYAADCRTDPDFDSCRAQIRVPQHKPFTKKERAAFVSLWNDIQTWRAFVGTDRKKALDVLMEEAFRPLRSG